MKIHQLLRPPPLPGPSLPFGHDHDVLAFSGEVLGVDILVPLEALAGNEHDDHLEAAGEDVQVVRCSHAAESCLPVCVRPGRRARQPMGRPSRAPPGSANVMAGVPACRRTGLPVRRRGRANVMAGVLMPSRAVEVVAGARGWSSSPSSSWPELMAAPPSEVVAVDLVARDHGQAAARREVREREGEEERHGRLGERSKRSHERAHGREQ
nr:unnamed protein product [Digitaria exilis]